MTKIAKDSFSYLGPDFQIRLLAQIITDNKFAESIIEILDPNYFKDQSLKLITSSIKDAYSEYNIIPDYGSLEIRLLNSISSELDQKFTLTQLKKIKEASLNDGLVIQDMAMKFCKQEELKKSIKEIQTIIDKGDMSRYEDCEEILKKALSHGEQKDNGLNVLDNIDAVLEDDFRKPIPTGIKGLDEVMDGGLSKGELAIILAPFGVGKAQPLYSKILTPNGWTRMGDINVGDYVIGRDGKSTKVTEVFPQGKRPIYTVKFNDNTQTLCDAEHLWAVNTINQRNRKTKKAGKIVYLEPDNTFKVMKTIDMINSTKVWSGKRLNYKIPTVLPVEFNKKDLTINPYLLGVILGDGCVTTNNQPHFVTKDYDIISEVSKIYNNISITEQTRDIEKDINGELVLVKRSLTKVSLLGIKESLIKLNLYGTNSSTKFIPKDYLYSSVCDRVSLLQGLVDTDGYIDAHRVEISTVSKQLSEDIKELILSLGGKVSISEKIGKYDNTECKLYYRISFSFPDNGIIPSRLYRKSSKFKPRTKYSDNKFIKSIEYFGEEEAQCIMVENPEHLYVTDDYIVTHNTTMMTKIANTATELGYKTLQIFFEDTEKIIQRKHLACWSGYKLNDLSLHKDELKNLVEEKRDKKLNLRLKRFPSDSTTIPIIKQYIRKLIAQGFRPDVILLDYIDVVQPSTKMEDANVGEGAVMRQFETLLAEFDIAGWTAVQGNRSSIKSEVVEADQMGGSIKKGQIGHFVVSIAKTLDQKENGTATMAILKSRFGKDGIVFQDIKFDNATIQINMEENQSFKTRTEYKKEQAKTESSYIANLMQKRKNAIGGEEQNNNVTQ